MAELKYVIGDATRPPKSFAPRIIAHVCNDQGGWGAGFVLAISARDSRPEIDYHRWHETNGPTVPFALGKVRIVPYCEETEAGLFVANMIAQHAFGKDGKPPIRYTALASCLNKLSVIAKAMQPAATIHMPRIGCGLAGGKWEGEIELLVQRFLIQHDVDVTVYDLPR
jgi:O-acetyl-ADP-ribose deacetylase (regulator of RNase III)